MKKMQIKTLLTAILALLACPNFAQQLQILRPDSSVFTSIEQYDFITVRHLTRGDISGQLTEITSNTLTVVARKTTHVVALSEIRGLKKTSKFGIAARKASPYSFIIPILVAPSWNSEFYKGRTIAHKIWVHAVILIPAGVGIGLLMKGRPLKKTKKGYYFSVIE